MHSILIADDNKEWLQILEAKIKQDADFYVVAKAYDGKEALKLIDLHRPEVIILDIVMPEFDGAYIVDHIRKHFHGYDPIIYILSGIGTDTIIKILNDLNVDFYSMKPVDLNALLQKLKEVVTHRALASAAPSSGGNTKEPSASGGLLSGMVHPPNGGNTKGPSAATLEETVMDVVCKLGILPHLRANQSACEAITYYINNPKSFQQLTKTIYPEVAKLLHTSPTAVERNIRRAVYHMLQNKTELYKEIFAYYPVEFITNSEFLSIVSNYIASQLKEAPLFRNSGPLL